MVYSIHYTVSCKGQRADTTGGGGHIQVGPCNFLAVLCHFFLIQSVQLKTQPNNNHVLRYKNKIRSRSIPVQVIYSPDLPRDTQVNLDARALLKPVAQELCKCEHGVFTSRTCVRSPTLLRI
jgi:hypothetical protein